jgi:hypothetical protein
VEIGCAGGVSSGHATASVNPRLGLGPSEVPGVLFSARNRGIITTVGAVF